MMPAVAPRPDVTVIVIVNFRFKVLPSSGRSFSSNVKVCFKTLTSLWWTAAGICALGSQHNRVCELSDSDRVKNVWKDQAPKAFGQFVGHLIDRIRGQAGIIFPRRF